MVYSDCPSMSMKPGATTLPRASIVRARFASLRLPMAAIFPSRIPTSPEYHGEPVPSIMWPSVITRSKDWRDSCTAESNRQVKSKTKNAVTDARTNCISDLQFIPDFRFESKCPDDSAFHYEGTLIARSKQWFP